jgi:hypothetical protein
MPEINSQEQYDSGFDQTQGEVAERFAEAQGRNWKNESLAEQDVNVNEVPDVPEGAHLPRSSDDAGKTWGEAGGGMWGGEKSIDAHRGNSEWYSNNAEAYDHTKGEPIRYEGGKPDFTPYVEKTALTEQTGDNARDFASADRSLARQEAWVKPDGAPNASEAARFRKENDLTWHHNQDQRTMEAVPRDVHESAPHTGGAAISRTEVGRTREVSENSRHRYET